MIDVPFVNVSVKVCNVTDGENVNVWPRPVLVVYWTVAVRMGGVFNFTASVAILFVITYAGVANWTTGTVTVCVAMSELLPLKLLSPTYVAVRLLLPMDAKVMPHVPE